MVTAAAIRRTYHAGARRATGPRRRTSPFALPPAATRVTLKVDSVTDFVAANRIPDIFPVEGEPLARLRRALAFQTPRAGELGAAEMWVAERHGYRGAGLNYRQSQLREGYDPTQLSPESRFVPSNSRDLLPPDERRQHRTRHCPQVLGC